MNNEALCSVHLKQTKTDLAKPEAKRINTIEILVNLFAHCFLLNHLSTSWNSVNI